MSDATDLPSHCFLNISVGGSDPRNVVIELFREKCPRTCRNFVLLCSNDATTSKSNPTPTYRGCEFHRIVPGFMVQGGDFQKFDGTGGYAPLTGGTFKDESFTIPHNAAGIVSMANKGPHTNGSQFFITLKPTRHLDKKHVVFGKVVEGMSVVESMTNVEVDGTKPVPMQRIVIVDCGVGQRPAVVDSTEESDQESRRERKQRSKKKDKKHKKRRKRHRDDDSLSTLESGDSASSKDYRRQKKRRKKHQKSGKKRRKEA